MTPPVQTRQWAFWLIAVGAAIFVVALGATVPLAPATWLLHLVQSLIYVAVAALAWGRSAWAIGSGFTVAVLWNAANLFVTGFAAAGVEALGADLRMGKLGRPELLLILVGVTGHFLMIAGCAGAWGALPPGRRRWMGLAGGVVAAILAMVAIAPLRLQLHAYPLPLDVPPRAAGNAPATLP
jgi:hypothetical protein